MQFQDWHPHGVVVSPDLRKDLVEAVQLSIFVATRSAEVEQMTKLDSARFWPQLQEVLNRIGWITTSIESQQFNLALGKSLFLPSTIEASEQSELAYLVSQVSRQRDGLLLIVNAEPTTDSVTLTAKCFQRMKVTEEKNATTSEFASTLWVGNLNTTLFENVRPQLSKKLTSALSRELTQNPSSNGDNDAR